MTAKLLNRLIGLGFPPEQAKHLDDRYDAIANKTIFIPAGIGKAGAGAGFTTANNTGNARVPASQTAATFTLPITGLKLGDTITAFKVVAQIESAGNTATLDADLRRLTNVAADPTDASLGAITQVSVTADTAVASSKTLDTAEVLATGEMVYLLVTVTTAASTDVQFAGVEVTIQEAQE